MNRLVKLSTLALLGVTCVLAGAEDYAPPQPRTPERPPADSISPDSGRQMGRHSPPPPLHRGGQGQPVARMPRKDSARLKAERSDAFLEHLRLEDPAEADRLQHLRQTDKPAFILAVKQRLNARKLELALRKYPEIMEAFKTLSQTEREDVVGLLSGQTPSRSFSQEENPYPLQGLPGISASASQGPSDPRPAGDAEREAATLELARAYRTRSDPVERERLNKEILARLEEIFDTREAFQEQQVAAIEATLLQLKSRIETRKSQRREIIERRRRELTGSDALSW
jgi:hypothetical protein